MKIMAVIFAFIAMSAVAFAGSLDAPGYYSYDLAINIRADGSFGGFDFLPNGDIVYSDGASIKVISPDGTELSTLYAYPNNVYGSFVRYNAFDDMVYFGESSAGTIMAVSSSGGNASLVAVLSGNYDIDFWNGTPYATAGNTIYMIGAGGQVDAIAQAGVVSGPLAFDNLGNLIFGTGNPNWPPTTNDQYIYRWSAAQVASAIGPSQLSASDAIVLGSEVNGPMAFLFDGFSGQLIWADNINKPAALRYLQGVSSSPIFATTNTPEGTIAWISAIRRNPVTGNLCAAVSYMDATWTTRTVLTTLVQVPEPSSVMALCSFIGLAATGKLLRRRK